MEKIQNFNTGKINIVAPNAVNTYAADNSSVNIFGQPNDKTAENSEISSLTRSTMAGLLNGLKTVFNNMPHAWNDNFSELKDCMDAIRQKSTSIHEESLSLANSYINSEMQSILGDDSKTDEEKKEAIELLEEKAKAIVEEANHKYEILGEIMKACAKIADATLFKDTSGINFSKCFENLNKMVSNINTSPTGFDKAKDINELEKLQQKSNEEILGKSNKDNSSNISELKDEIKKQQEIIDNKESNEKEKLQAQCLIASYEAQIKVYQKIESLIQK